MNYYNLFRPSFRELKRSATFSSWLQTTHSMEEDTNPDAEQQPDENLECVWWQFFKKTQHPARDGCSTLKTLLYSASYQSLKQPSSPYVIALNKTDAGKHTLTYLHMQRNWNPTHNHYRKTMAGGTWNVPPPFGKRRPLQKTKGWNLPALPISWTKIKIRLPARTLGTLYAQQEQRSHPLDVQPIRKTSQTGTLYLLRRPWTNTRSPHNIGKLA